MPLAALYIRSSKDRADVSPEAQRDELLQLAGVRKLQVVREYLDVVQSGKTEDRPGFQELLQDLRDPRRTWTQLLMLDTSRLARNLYLAQAFEHECRRRGITVVYAKLPDMDPITEVIVKATFQAFDQVHSMMSKAKGIAGMATNVRRGFRAGGRAPRGYRLEHVDTGATRDGKPVRKSRLVLGPDADTVRRYLQARAAGSPRHVAVRDSGLEDSGLVDLEWNALTYAGMTVWNMRNPHDRGYESGTKRRPRAEWVIQEDTHDPLITRAEAERLLQHLEVSNHGARRHRLDGMLLGGILKTPAGLSWQSDGHKTYRARRPCGRYKTVVATAIEAAVLAQIAADMTSPAFIKAVAIETRNSMPAARRGLKPLRKQIAELDRRISNMMDAAAEMKGNRSPALRRLQELEDDRARLQLQLEMAIEDLAKAEAVRSLSEDQVRETIESLPAAPLGDAQAMRDHVGRLVDKIELDTETGECRLFYRFQAAQERGGRRTRDDMASPSGRDLNPLRASKSPFLTATRAVPESPFRRRRSTAGANPLKRKTATPR